MVCSEPEPLARESHHPAAQELLLDSDTIADKILKNQHFHKASQAEREQILKHILAKGPAGSLASKMAHVVSDKHQTYRQRIDAMKKLLDMHTDALKDPKIKHAHGASSASALDLTDVKAIKEGVKLIKAAKKAHTPHLKLSAKDAKIKAETEHAVADPKKLDNWMKLQVKGKSATAHAKHVEAKHAEAKHAAAAKAQADAGTEALAEVETHRHHKAAAAGGHHKETKFVKLVKWAEAHGLPKSLANNPKDRTKVKDIIARMKADAEVEKIQAEFAKDDSVVGDVIHAADPAAAGAV